MPISTPTTPLVVPVPEGKTYLPFQIPSIHSLANSTGILLADEMGLGKTISVIGALNYLKTQKEEDSPPQRVLIVSPKSVLPNWNWELNNWLVDQNWQIGMATAQGGLPDTAWLPSAKDQPQILLINYDIVDKHRDELEQTPWDIVVCDEAHFLKNPKAIRTRAILGDLASNRRMRQTPLPTTRLWLLTGSPLLNNPSELYTLLKSIDPECQTIPELDTQDAFGDRYSHKREAPWGVVYRGGRNLPELRHLLRTPRQNDGTPLMIRRTKAEVLKDLPPKRHQLLPLWDPNQNAAAGERRIVELSLQELIQRIEQRTVKKTKKKKTKTVVELKALCKENNLKVSGKKQELMDRLQENGILFEEEEEVESSDDKEDTPAEEEDNSPANNETIYMSAQSALRSQGQGTSIVQDLLGMLYQQEADTTKADKDSIRGLLASARHETAKQKVPHAIELIQEQLDNDNNKVVVFAHHRDVQSELRDAFGSSAVGITGGDSLDDRADAVQRFQTDPSVRVFVGSITAAGVGITLSAASHVIFVELDWSPLVVQQAEDRCHRVGQKNSVLVQYLFFPDTIDEYLSQLLAAKQSTITAAIDEPSGSASWVLDFGKHEGLCVADVAGSNPSYLEWLVKTKAKTNILERKPELASALVDLGFMKNLEGLGKDEGPKKGESLGTETTTNDHSSPPPKKSKHGSYVITFGKHKGKSLADIPTGYLQWLRSSGATRRNPTMGVCLTKHLNERRQSTKRQQ